MSAAEYEPLYTEPDARLHVVKFVGGTAAVTKLFGRGVTVTYISSGIVELAWTRDNNPGKFIGCVGHCFEATTASGIKGYTVVPGVYNTTTRKLRVNITNAAETLTDLAALQWLTLNLLFTEGNRT